mmetsp:Transcript_24056/g.63423  ORF Transcript_24056/g.63423 Transcript_24056/m.63423 type:complete len:516 (-) Transcript_24056:231-1778(-)
MALQLKNGAISEHRDYYRNAKDLREVGEAGRHPCPSDRLLAAAVLRLPLRFQGLLNIATKAPRSGGRRASSRAHGHAHDVGVEAAHEHEEADQDADHGDAPAEQPRQLRPPEVDPGRHDEDNQAHADAGDDAQHQVQLEGKHGEAGRGEHEGPGGDEPAGGALLALAEDRLPRHEEADGQPERQLHGQRDLRRQQQVRVAGARLLPDLVGVQDVGPRRAAERAVAVDAEEEVVHEDECVGPADEARGPRRRPVPEVAQDGHERPAGVQGEDDQGKRGGHGHEVLRPPPQVPGGAHYARLGPGRALATLGEEGAAHAPARAAQHDQRDVDPRHATKRRSPLEIADVLQRGQRQDHDQGDRQEEHGGGPALGQQARRLPEVFELLLQDQHVGHSPAPGVERHDEGAQPTASLAHHRDHQLRVGVQAGLWRRRDVHQVRGHRAQGVHRQQRACDEHEEAEGEAQLAQRVGQRELPDPHHAEHQVREGAAEAHGALGVGEGRHRELGAGPRPRPHHRRA